MEKEPVYKERQIPHSQGIEVKSESLLRKARRVPGFKLLDKAPVEHCMKRLEQGNETLTKEEALERTTEVVNFTMCFAQFLMKGEKETRPSAEKYVPMEIVRMYLAVKTISYEIQQNSKFQTAQMLVLVKNI